MGMFTELVLKCDVRPNISDEVKSVLNFLFNDRTKIPEVLPDHPFFGLPRWSLIGSSSSYHHIPWSDSKYSEHYLFSRSDLKNYDSEIEQFIDWFSPYVCEDAGYRVIGWKWYEEDDEPELIRI